MNIKGFGKLFSTLFPNVNSFIFQQTGDSEWMEVFDTLTPLVSMRR